MWPTAHAYTLIGFYAQSVAIPAPAAWPSCTSRIPKSCQNTTGIFTEPTACVKCTTMQSEVRSYLMDPAGAHEAEIQPKHPSSILQNRDGTKTRDRREAKRQTSLNSVDFQLPFNAFRWRRGYMQTCSLARPAPSEVTNTARRQRAESREIWDATIVIREN